MKTVRGFFIDVKETLPKIYVYLGIPAVYYSCMVLFCRIALQENILHFSTLPAGSNCSYFLVSKGFDFQIFQYFSTNNHLFFLFLTGKSFLN